MGNRTKIWLVLAVSLVLVGCVIFGGVMGMLHWDFTKLSTAKYETNRSELDTNYKNIAIVTKTADVVLVPAENGKTAVVCYEQANCKHTVAVKDDTLTIEIVDMRKWYEYIGFYFTAPKITIYLPQEQFGTLSIKSDTGDVEIPKDFRFASMDITESTGNVTSYASASERMAIQTTTGDIQLANVSAGSLDLSVSTGDVQITDVACTGDVNIHVSTGKINAARVECKNLISKGSTGDLLLQNVVAGETFSIERSTGDVHFADCDAGEIRVNTDTGDVKGSLLTEKVFFTQTDTGRVDVPRSTAGGRCEITTDTGNIEISISK